MLPLSDDQERIDREASAWLVRDDAGLPAEDRAAFHAWRSADPRHGATYDAMARTWRELPELSELADLVPLSPEPRRSPEPPSAHRHWRNWAGAISVAAAALAAFLVLPGTLFERGEGFTTQIAELRLITLPDGSSVTLGARSTIKVRFTERERRVVLAGGEAFFDATHDAARPFLVEAGDTIVRDIGTKFNVNLSSETVRVAVAEGSVAVSRTGTRPIAEHVLVAGQRTEILLSGAAVPMPASPTGMITSGNVAPNKAEVIAIQPAAAPAGWREGRLTYDNVRLADLVADVNRYYAPGIVLGRGGIGELRVTASFKTSEIGAFMGVLSDSLPVRAEPTGGGGFAIRDAR